jgi:hypothetical protein
MPSGKKIIDVVVGETKATVDIKMWRNRRVELPKSQKFHGEQAYVGEPAIDSPHKKTRSQDTTLVQKREKKSKTQKKKSSRTSN